jgi:hypothetical protein
VDVDFYRVEQQRASEAWTVLGIVRQLSGQWSFSLETPRLDDLTAYTWRVIGVDVAGNDGAPLVLGPETMVRTPNAPRFTISFDDVSHKVTFAAP